MLIEISNLDLVSTNNVYHNTSRGRMITLAGKKFKQLFPLMAKYQIGETEKYDKSSRLFVEIAYHYPSNMFYTTHGKIKKNDLDNYLKLTIDCLFQALNRRGFKINDSQIFKISASKVVIDSNLDKDRKIIIMLNKGTDVLKYKNKYTGDIVEAFQADALMHMVTDEINESGRTVHRDHMVYPFDWVIQQQNGNKYVFNPGIFDTYYERVADVIA